MGKPRRLSDETAAVIEVFLADPERDRYGREIVRLTELKSGSLYPMLGRLEDRGILRSRWEDLEAAVARGQRPRRLYHLRADRVEEAEGLVSEWRAARSSPRHSSVGRELPA